MTTYAEIKSLILSTAHRPDLSAEVAGFVKLAEGMIRRDLRASTFVATLDDSVRVADGVYTLPSTLLEVRAITRSDGYALDPVGVNAIRSLAATDPVLQYAVHGTTVEFRGVPGAGDEFELHYFGHPAALSDDEDELQLDDALYLYGALFHLYQYTQDLELAQAALDTFTDALDKLNEQIGRKLGGARQMSTYWFGPLTKGY